MPRSTVQPRSQRWCRSKLPVRGATYMSTRDKLSSGAGATIAGAHRPLLGECRMNSRILSSVALAAAAAVMFSAVTATVARADEGKVKCEGVNSCKGHSACKSANNACKGQNSCKGKGFLEMTKAECDAAKAKATK